MTSQHLTTKSRRARRQNNGWIALAFLAPALVALFFLRLLPAAIAAGQSLFHTSILQISPTFVGLGNYIGLFQDPDFRGSLGVTLLFAVIINPLQIAASFLLAVLFTRKVPAGRIWRSFVIVPVAVPPAVIAVVWNVILQPDGLANGILGIFGIGKQPFLTSSNQALASIIVLLSWAGVGYWMLFLISGINDVPQETLEAATLDGAGAFRRIWSVVLPLVRRPLAFVLVADTVSNFTVFAPSQILTQGGPNGSTNLLMYDIYTRAYSLNDTNRAEAEVVILVAITLIIVAVQFRLLRSDNS